MTTLFQLPGYETLHLDRDCQGLHGTAAEPDTVQALHASGELCGHCSDDDETLADHLPDDVGTCPCCGFVAKSGQASWDRTPAGRPRCPRCGTIRQSAQRSEADRRRGELP